MIKLKLLSQLNRYLQSILIGSFLLQIFNLNRYFVGYTSLSYHFQWLAVFSIFIDFYEYLNIYVELNSSEI